MGCGEFTCRESPRSQAFRGVSALPHHGDDQVPRLRARPAHRRGLGGAAAKGMSVLQLTRNYTDRSNPQGFQLAFSCDQRAAHTK
jgi:hypothetical protein